MSWFKAKYAAGVEFASYLSLAVVVLLLWMQAVSIRDDAIKAAHLALGVQQATEARTVARVIQHDFRQMYQGIRTIARLPGVRNSGPIQRLTDDARISAQEIYNALAENVLVSELYIVPIEFDAEAAAASKEPASAHLTTFDSIIIGRTADNTTLAKTKDSHQAVEIEEFEYREMRRQLDDFVKRFPSDRTISKLAYPAIISQELITCDNSKYSPSHPNDQDRTGFVYSVPYFGGDGQFRGIVSAVILKSIIEQHLRNGKYALESAARNISIGSKSQPERALSDETKPGGGTAINAPVANQSLAVVLPGMSQPWVLRSATFDLGTVSHGKLEAAQAQYWLRCLTLLAAAVMLGALLRWEFHRRQRIVLRNRELEFRIEERTEAIEKALREAEVANAAKSQFLARVSHDFRTPLHAIMSSTELLRTKIDSNPKEMLTISNASQSLLGLVNQILDLESLEKGQLTLTSAPFCPEGLAKEVRDMLLLSAERKGIHLKLQVADGTPEKISADAAHIRQVLVNLVANAVKFTASGHVLIHVSASNSLAPAWIKFEVTDTGPGIPRAQYHEVFEPFRRVSSATLPSVEGMGLGLAISKQLVEAMSGVVGFSSTEDKGSSFWFRVPYTTTSETAMQRIADTFEAPLCADTSLEHIDVLLAEDHPTMQQLGVETLERLGCTVRVASDGQEAVAHYLERRPDVVLMDCRMPGVDGLEATRQIRAHEAANFARPVAIVALTASAFAGDQIACEQAGMSAFLSKPFSQAELLAVIKKTLAVC